MLVFTLSSLSPLILTRSSRYPVPLESTTIQLGSGVPGALKSLDRVRTCLPALTSWVTVPPLTVFPLKGMVVSAAKALAAPRRPIVTKAVKSYPNKRTRRESFMVDPPLLRCVMPFCRRAVTRNGAPTSTPWLPLGGPERASLPTSATTLDT